MALEPFHFSNHALVHHHFAELQREHEAYDEHTTRRLLLGHRFYGLRLTSNWYSIRSHWLEFCQPLELHRYERTHFLTCTGRQWPKSVASHQFHCSLSLSTRAMCLVWWPCPSPPIEWFHSFALANTSHGILPPQAHDMNPERICAPFELWWHVSSFRRRICG